MESFDEAEESYQNAIGFAPISDRPKIQSSLAQVRARRAAGTTMTSSRYPGGTAPVQSPPTRSYNEPAQELEGSSSYPAPITRHPAPSASDTTRK